MPPPLNVGLFAPYDLSSPGGVNTQIRAQARALRARGHIVTIHGPASAPLADGEVALGGSSRVTLGGTESGLGLNPFNARRVAEVFRDSTFDVVHVHEPLTPIVPWFVLRQARAPIVGTFHVHRERGHRLYEAGRPFLRTLMRRVAYRIAVSESARRTVAEHFPGPYHIVPNGIDVDGFAAPRPRPPAFAPGVRHVLYVGRLEPRKGLEFLIRAMPRVAERAPATRLLIVGDGPDRGKLESLARAVRCDVRFDGRVGDDDLPAYFQACDVVCSPATGGESFGIVLLEAMAAGRAVVASDIHGYKKVVQRNVTGLLVEPKDPDALCGALAQLIDDPALRDRLGATGARRAVDFDWEHVARQLVGVYEEVLSLKKSRV